MLDQLLNLVKENAQDAIVKNNAVPNQHNDAAIGEVGNVIQNVLGSAVQNGNLQDVLAMFSNSNNLQNNPLVGNIISQLAGSLGSKFNVSSGNAQSIASSLIPQVLALFAKKTNDPNDTSLNINDIMSDLGGQHAKGIDFSNVISQMQSGQNVDLGDLASQFQGSNKSAGMADVLGGLFK